jgi:hypothetical protein
MKTTIGALASTAALALALAACGGGPASPTQPSATAGGAGSGTTPPAATAGSNPGGPAAPGGINGDDACGVQSAGDIQAATGGTISSSAPAKNLQLFAPGCQYDLTLPGASSPVTVNVQVIQTGGRVVYDANAEGSGLPEIAGIGDAAVNQRRGTVLAIKGDTLVSVEYIGPSGPDEGPAGELVKRAFANLGV